MIWDTAGQESFRSISSLYYKDADAVVLVYDITNKESFNELKYWITEVERHCARDVILAIAGNKCDALDDEAVDPNSANDFAIKNNATFYLVSAKENCNVNEMYMDLGRKKFPELENDENVDNEPMISSHYEGTQLTNPKINNKKGCC